MPKREGIEQFAADLRGGLGKKEGQVFLRGLISNAHYVNTKVLSKNEHMSVPYQNR